MTSLMEGDATLLVGSHHLGLLLQSTYDTVNGIEEVLLAHRLLVMASSYQGSLVANIGDVGTREARRLASQEINVNGIVYLDRLQVNEEDGLTFVQAREIDMNLTVETTCTQEGAIQHIYTVGSGKDDDTTVGAETIHLGEEGIQSVLTLIVATHGRVLATSSTYGINLIDEDDARSFLLSLTEEVANTRGTDADKHFHEVGTAHGEEWYLCLACYSLGKEGLTCSRRTYQQGSLWNLTTEVGVFLWVLEEIDDFLNLLFGTLLSGYVLEGDTDGVSLLIHTSLALADTEDTASHATAESCAHSARHPHDEEEEE